MPASRFVIALCGETFPQIKSSFDNFDSWFIQRLSGLELDIQVWNAHDSEALPDISGLTGCIVTGSPAMVTDRAKWSERLAEWLLACIGQNVPLLGVCYGHQLIADALGGSVDFQPDGREIGSLLICLNQKAREDALFSDLPEQFYAHLTHGQSVLSLPDGAENLASSQRVTHQVFRYGESCWGVQFHPEFTKDIMGMYLDAYHNQIPAEMRVQLHTHLHDCPDAESLIGRFAEYCLNRTHSL